MDDTRQDGPRDGRPDPERQRADQRMAEALDERLKRRRPPGPKKWSDVLARLLSQRGYAAVLGGEALGEAWAAAAGPKLAALTRARRLQSGRLEIVTANSVVVQELSFQKQELLRRMRELLPDAKIRDLKFHQGPLG